MDNDLTFIESQFPVSKLSKGSYKERKANYSQTLTGLGKWWGRKPLIMVRATIFGLLLPASGDPGRDREIFLKVLTMDDEGLWRRKSKAIALKDLIARLSPAEQARWFRLDAAKPRYIKGTSREQKAEIQRLVFERLSYDDKLRYCDRPEQVTGPSEDAWADINDHLGTVRKSRLACPHCGVSTPMSAIRGDRRSGGSTDYGLRLWENDDLVPRPDDVFQERLAFAGSRPG